MKFEDNIITLLKNKGLSENTINLYMTYLHKLNDNIVETIMFASTCNTLILSKGTLSWLIGILSFYATSIYYPQSPINFKSNIFVIPEWTEIDLKIE